MAYQDTLLAPVGWMNRIEFEKCGNGNEVFVITNNDKKFKVGFLRRITVQDDENATVTYYHFTPKFMNCEPSMEVNKWILEQVEAECNAYGFKLW